MCEDLAEHFVGAPEGLDELVFESATGGPLRHGEFMRHLWPQAVVEAGPPDGLTPHELRHTAASLLIAHGAGPKSVQAQLGHSTIVTTFDTYSHLFEGHLDEVMDRLDTRWRQVQESRTEMAKPCPSRPCTRTAVPDQREPWSLVRRARENKSDRWDLDKRSALHCLSASI